MIIREIKPTDATQLHTLLGELGYSPELHHTEERIKLLSSLSNTKTWVAYINEKIIGFISVYWMETIIYPRPLGRIIAFCVTEEIRNKGIGSLLLQKAEDHLIAIGCYHIEVTSNNKREFTHVFYQKHNYEHTSRKFIKKLN